MEITKARFVYVCAPRMVWIYNFTSAEVFAVRTAKGSSEKVEEKNEKVFFNVVTLEIGPGDGNEKVDARFCVYVYWILRKCEWEHFGQKSEIWL